MRISDWSSDVCSSDLDRGGIGGRFEPQPIAAFLPAPACQRAGARLPVGRRIETRDHAEAERRILWQILDHAGDAIILLKIAAGERQRLDRKSTRLNSSH